MRLMVCLSLGVLSTRAVAQAPLRVADSLYAALKPADAVEWYQKALGADSGSYEVLWKTARAVVDVAKQLEGKPDARQTRDSLYGVAHLYAVRAVRANPDDANGHFVLALALGRLSRTKGGKERVRYGRTIYDEAARALTLPGRHDGPHHILGAWHAEVRRLSPISRFFAKTFFGGGFLSIASWDSAVVHLEAAVKEDPTHLYHHFELAEILIDLDRYGEARKELAAVASLPPTSDVLDPVYQRRAKDLSNRIARKN